MWIVEVCRLGDMIPHIPRLRGSVVLGVALAAVFLLPAVTVAHADLQSSVPAQGAVVPSPFAGPIVLTFSELLAAGSKADLIGSDGATVGGAIVDVSAMTMTIDLTAPLDPGTYEVRWVSIAGDGDVLRQPIVRFTVAPAAVSLAPPVATATPSAAVSAVPSTATPTMASVSSAPSPSLAPTPVPSGSGDTTGSGGDVVVPIIVALIVLGAGAAYLLTRRNRPAGPA